MRELGHRIPIVVMTAARDAAHWASEIAATAFVIAMCDTAAAIARVLGEDPGEWERAADAIRGLTHAG